MTYDPSNPPFLVSQGVAGARGGRTFIYTWTDSLTDITAAGYFPSDIGLREGDTVIFKDLTIGLWHQQALIVQDVATDGTPTVAVPEIVQDALPEDDIDPLTDYLVIFRDGRMAYTPASGLFEDTGVTTGYVDAAVAGVQANLDTVESDLQAAIDDLVGAAPGQLDTLNELAAALGDDANFAATVTAALGGKVPTTRTISAGGLATGGGDLSANRTITVPKASAADVAAATDDTKALTPLSIAALVTATDSLPTVYDFGAVGDGVADDTTALQNALDANKLVFMPPGEYRITVPLISNPQRNRGGGFLGLAAPSYYPDTGQGGTGPSWDGTQESIIKYDGPSVSELSTTAATSVGIVVGTRGFTAGTGKLFAAGMQIVIRRTAAPTTNYMAGTVISYNSGTGALSVDVTVVSSSVGTFAGWTITAPTACLAVAGEFMTIEPGNSFGVTPLGLRLENIVFHGNDKALYGLYMARVQNAYVTNVVGYKAKGDGIYINGSFSGTFTRLVGHRNGNRGIAIGAAGFDHGWLVQNYCNGARFNDLWGLGNGRNGTYNDSSAPTEGCGIFFGPHRACAVNGWTAELNDGMGFMFAPTNVNNQVFNGYTELNSSADITGSGSAITTGRATRSYGFAFYGAAGGASFGNEVSGLYCGSEYLRLMGSEPSTGRKGVVIKQAFGTGVVGGWANYELVDSQVDIIDGLIGTGPNSHGVGTLTLYGASTAGVNTYSVQNMTWTVVNDYCTVNFRIVLTAKGGTLAGGLLVGPLPFAAKSSPVMFYGASMTEWVLAGAGTPVGRVESGESWITFQKDTNAGNTSTALAAADINNTSRLAGSVTYRIR